MSDSIKAFEQLTATARLALGRGDREGAQAALSAAIRSPEDVYRLGVGNADAIISLGTLNQDAGLHAEAERLFAEALVVAERASAPDDVGVIPALTKLGTALIARGAHAEAEPLLTRALAISEQRLGAEHPDLIVLLNDLSRLYLKQGAYERAEPLLNRLLAFKRSKGDDHPEVATVLASIAVVRQAAGDHDAAEQLYRRVLQIRERTLAPNHFAVAAALEHLGEACAARGKTGEALALFQRALSVREQSLAPGHASLRIARERIADLQLQASEESADASTTASPVFQLPPLAPPVVPSIVAAPMSAIPPAVRVSSPVALPPDGVPASLRAMPTPLVSDIERAPVIPVGRSEDARIDEATPHVGRLDAIDPSAQSVVESRDVSQEIEEEEEEDYQLQQGFAASVKKILPQRRVQALAIGAGAIALLFAALAAHPDAPNDDTHLNASEVGSITDPSSVNALPAGNIGSPVTGSSNGAIEPRSFGSTASERNDRTTAEKSPAKGNQQAGNGSLELGNLPRTPTADIATLHSDSIVRAAASPKTDGAASAIQLIASGSEKKLATPDFSDSKGGPTRAKLRGAMPQPLYPEYLRKVGVRGEVVVQFMVDETGRPEMGSLKVVQSPHEFLTDEVRRAVMKMRFDPAHTGGSSPKPTADLVQISFVFDALTK